MKKTATITFSNSFNYGAILQMYALQKSVLDIGYSNEVINYKDVVQMKEYNVLDLFDIKSFFRSLIFCIPIFFRNRSFKAFIHNNVAITHALKKNELYKLEEDYDIFISGSDQVWNIGLIEEDGSYFLDFIKKKSKISYAASLAVSSIAEGQAVKYFKWLNSYDVISVREETAKLLLDTCLKKDIYVDIDPVFLLERNVWLQFLKEKRKGKYILAYLLDQAGVDFAKEMARKKNAKLIRVVYIKEISLLHPKRNVGDCRLNVSPEEWLTLIYNADCVITGSFHAVAFSLLFHKEFYVKFCNAGTARITDLLSRVNMEEDVAWNNMDLFPFIDTNWEKVDKKIDSLRKQSLLNLTCYLNASKKDV